MGRCKYSSLGTGRIFCSSFSESIHPLIFPSFCLFIHRSSIYPYNHPLFIHLSSIHPSIIHPFIYPSIHPSTHHQSTHPSPIYPSTYYCIRPSKVSVFFYVLQRHTLKTRSGSFLTLGILAHSTGSWKQQELRTLCWANERMTLELNMLSWESSSPRKPSATSILLSHSKLPLSFCFCFEWGLHPGRSSFSIYFFLEVSISSPQASVSFTLLEVECLSFLPRVSPSRKAKTSQSTDWFPEPMMYLRLLSLWGNYRQSFPLFSLKLFFPLIIIIINKSCNFPSLLFYLREAKTSINFSQFIFSITGLKCVHEITTASLKRWLSELSVLVVKASGHEFKSQRSYKSLAWTRIDRWRYVDLARGLDKLLRALGSVRDPILKKKVKDNKDTRHLPLASECECQHPHMCVHHACAS